VRFGEKWRVCAYDEDGKFIAPVEEDRFDTLAEAERHAKTLGKLWPSGTTKIVILASTVILAIVALFGIWFSETRSSSNSYISEDVKPVTPYHGSVISGDFFPTVGIFCKHIYQTVAKAAALTSGEDASAISAEVSGEVALHSSRVVVTKSLVHSGCKYDDFPNMKPVDFDLVEVTVRDGNSDADGKHGYVSDASLSTR
jgi:hypothetical protein